MKKLDIITAIRNADLEGIKSVDCKVEDLVKLANHILDLEALCRRQELQTIKLTSNIELLQSSIVKAAKSPTVHLDELA